MGFCGISYYIMESDFIINTWIIRTHKVRLNTIKSIKYHKKHEKSPIFHGFYDILWIFIVFSLLYGSDNIVIVRNHKSNKNCIKSLKIPRSTPCCEGFLMILWVFVEFMDSDFIYLLINAYGLQLIIKLIEKTKNVKNLWFFTFLVFSN